jgi:hypothetical protein
VPIGINNPILWEQSGENRRNKCVFGGCNPNVNMSFRAVDEERKKWEIAGAKGLSHLAAPLAEN